MEMMFVGVCNGMDGPRKRGRERMKRKRKECWGSHELLSYCVR